MHYYVVGINGSGKTTVLEAVGKKLGMPVVHGTTELMMYLGIPGNYEKLREMDQDYVLQKWGETANKLVEAHKGRDLLLDTHILNLTNGNIIQRDGPWIASFGALVEIKANATTTLWRIQKDTDKDRSMFRPKMTEGEKLRLLIKYQNETDRLFKELAKRYNMPSQVIDNSGDVQNAVDSFESFHQTLIGT